MVTYVHFIEDSNGQVLETEYFCSELCYSDAGHSQSGAWPGDIEANYCTYCNQCNKLISHGIEECLHKIKFPELKLEIRFSDSFNFGRKD